jgi:hypothetical protein
MRQALLFFVSVACLVACNANVVDAVRDPPPPVVVPDPEPVNPLTSSLIHRYSFDGEGESVLDSKGAAHGEAVAVLLGGDGQLALQGERSAQFVDLPNGLISGLSSATFEAWLTWQGGGDWQRIFDFGSSSAGEGLPGPTGTSYLFLTTASGEDLSRALPSALRAAFSENGVVDEDICHGPAPFPIGVATHVALVIDPTSEAMTLYQNGALLADCFLARPLSLIDDVNNWLGRSNYVADVDLSGSYDEFRIYGAALTAAEIADSFTAGPDAKP